MSLLFLFISLSTPLSMYLYYVLVYSVLRLCSSLGLLFAMLFIFPLPFRASDCVHNFLPIFIVCLVVYFAVHNLCLGSTTPLSAPLSLCSCSCLFVLCRFPKFYPCQLVLQLLLRSFVISLASPFFALPAPEFCLHIGIRARSSISGHCWSPVRVRVPGGNVLRSKCS